MSIRRIAVAIASIAAFSPTLSDASPERASVKACANAFASSIASPGVDAPAFRLAYRGGIQTPWTSFYPTDFTFVLEAHDPKSGSTVARARCSTNTRGVVTGIASLPLDSKPATLAAAY